MAIMSKQEIRWVLKYTSYFMFSQKYGNDTLEMVESSSEDPEVTRAKQEKYCDVVS